VIVATVLVVEDEWAIAHWLATVLEDAGHRVVPAGNGHEALQILATENVDLVLTDFMMPVMGASGLLRALNGRGLLPSLPVVVMSSLPETTIRAQCTGFRAYLAKPFREAELLETVRAYAAPSDI
jgi:two-component system chemotaxis sensor kinase CheA